MAKREAGTGTIRERKDEGRWEARIPLPNGKRKSIFVKSKREVADKLKATKRDIDAGLDVSIDGLTLATFLEDWHNNVVKPSTRPRTHHGYASYIRLHITSEIGHRKLKDHRQPDVDKMLRELTEKGTLAAHGPTGARHCPGGAHLCNASRDDRP